MQEKWLRKLKALLGPGGVETSPFSLSSYAYDAGLDRSRPAAVAFPTSTEQVVAIVKLASQERIPITPRGAGTGLSGGAVPAQGGLVVSFSRMNRILTVDWENRYATVQAGLVNMDLQNLLAKKGFFYAPDPSSQGACTLGGNVAENAGGPHCFRYGYTLNHILGLKLVTGEGDIIPLGGPWADSPGYPLVSLIVGSEGMLGLVTEVTVRFSPRPEGVKTILAAFATVRDAARAVSDIIACGIVPTTLEMMDRTIIEAVEASLKAGYPANVEAILLVEVEGFEEGLARQVELVARACSRHNLKELRVATTPKEAEALWAGRKGAAAAVGRVAPNQVTQDGSVPPSLLPRLLEEIQAIAERNKILIGNVMHAGDGNLHPIMVFDERDPDQVARVHAASREILAACVAAGGTITGEHGIGLEKKEYMTLLFGPEELNTMAAIKQALDPLGILNPGKMFPTPVGGA